MDLLDFFIGEVSENNASNKNPTFDNLVSKTCYLPMEKSSKPFKIYKLTQQNFCLSYIIMMNLSK